MGAPGSVAAIAQMLNLNNYKPSNGCKCGGTGYLAACSKANRWLALFGASTTCKPNDRDHLQEWHDPCPRGRPHGYRATRRRLSIWQYLNEMIGSVGNRVRSDERSDAIQQALQKWYDNFGEIPEPYQLIKFSRSKVFPPMKTAEAYEVIAAFEPTRR